MATGTFVIYQRVSTEKQGRSGLGLEAQDKAIEDFLNGGDWSVVGRFVEIESGKQQTNRPKLIEAIALAQATRSKLLIAKLDRLSRNAAFLLTLRDSGVEFICADMPDANRLTVGIMALVAEQEREQISARTKAALAAAKARGQVLGNPNGADCLRRTGKHLEGSSKGVAQIRANADAGAESLRGHLMNAIEAVGGVNLTRIAAELNRASIKTPRGGQWQAVQVGRLLDRLGV